MKPTEFFSNTLVVELVVVIVAAAVIIVVVDVVAAECQYPADPRFCRPAHVALPYTQLDAR